MRAGAERASPSRPPLLSLLGALPSSGTHAVLLDWGVGGERGGLMGARLRKATRFRAWSRPPPRVPPPPPRPSPPRPPHALAR